LWSVAVSRSLLLCLDFTAIRIRLKSEYVVVHCNALQHTATNCNALCRSFWVLKDTPRHHTATHSNILKHPTTHWNTQQHPATYCNTLQHTATHRSKLQQSVPVLLSSQKRQYGLHCKTLQRCNTL